VTISLEEVRAIRCCKSIPLRGSSLFFFREPWVASFLEDSIMVLVRREALTGPGKRRKEEKRTHYGIIHLLCLSHHLQKRLSEFLLVKLLLTPTCAPACVRLSKPLLLSLLPKHFLKPSVVLTAPLRARSCLAHVPLIRSLSLPSV